MKYSTLTGKTPNDWCCILAHVSPSQLRALQYMIPECVAHNTFDTTYKLRSARDLEWYMDLFTRRGLKIAKELPFQIRYPKARHDEVMEAINKYLPILRA